MVWRIIKAAWGATACVLLSGCAGYLDNVYAPERIQMLVPEEGRVIVSVGAPTSCLVLATAIDIRPYGSGPFSGRRQVFVDHNAVRSDFADHQGTVSVLNLKPGRYEVSTVAMPGINRSPTQVPRYQFALHPGENLYIGNFFMTQSCGMENAVRFVDRAQRDLPIVFARNPLFSPATVTTRIAEWDGYAFGGPSTAGRGGPIDNGSPPDGRPFNALPNMAALPPRLPSGALSNLSPGYELRPRAASPEITQPLPRYVSSGMDLESAVAGIKLQAQAILWRQIEQMPEPRRAWYSGSFERSVEAATPFIRRRAEASSMSEGEQATSHPKWEIVVTVVRNSWLVACLQAGETAAQDCEPYRREADEELDRGGPGHRDNLQ